jgi:hypothetical protein
MANVLEPSETQQTSTSHLGSTVTIDEPRQATNAGLSIALIAAVIIGIAMFMWGFAILKNTPYTDANTRYSAPGQRVNGQLVNTSKETRAKPRGDVSNVGSQAVSGDALTDTQVGDQK